MKNAKELQMILFLNLLYFSLSVIHIDLIRFDHVHKPFSDLLKNLNLKEQDTRYCFFRAKKIKCPRGILRHI